MCIGNAELSGRFESSLALANGITCSVSKGSFGVADPCVPPATGGRYVIMSFGGAPLASP